MQTFGALANVVRQSVSALTVGTDLGLAPNRDGKCLCIFHQDRHPSLKLYNGNRGYYCFVCHAHGDVIDMTAEVMHLTKGETLRWLNEQYGLGLPIGGNHDPDALRRAREDAERRARELEHARTHAEALNRAVEDAFRVWMVWNRAVDIMRPRTQSEGISEQFAEAVWQAELAREAYQCAQDELFAWNMKKTTETKGGDHDGSAARRSRHDPVHSG